MQASRPLDRTHLEGGCRSQRFHPRDPKSSHDCVTVFSRKRSGRDFAVEVRAGAACSKAVRSSMCTSLRNGAAESYLFSKNGRLSRLSIPKSARTICGCNSPRRSYFDDELGRWAVIGAFELRPHAGASPARCRFVAMGHRSAKGPVWGRLTEQAGVWLHR